MTKTFFYFVDNISASFEINDLTMISKRYKKIYLFVANRIEDKTQIPKNVVFFENYINWNKYNPLKYILKNFFSIISIYIYESQKIRKILPVKKAVALITFNIFKAECILTTCKKNNTNISDSILYSFWFYDISFLAWLKRKNKTLKVVSRAHGGDLFEYRGSISGKILFRNFQFRHLDFLFSVSETGTRYLQEKYSDFSHKIQTIFLGSRPQSSLSPYDSGTNFVLVSCATVRNIKRIHKIAETLRYINFPLTWYHIGSENLDSNDATISLYKKAKDELKNNQNINYIPLSSVDNSFVYDFYAKTPINLFVSLSEAEGIPVSMMEAISFGIPVLATDVGGCKEIVNEETGVLIPLQTEVKQVAEKISEFKCSEKNTVKFREGVRAFWQEKFDLAKNYETFFKIIAP